MRNLGAAIAGGGGKRREHDWYPTEPEAPEALLRVWKPKGRMVWEPACGDGAMSRVIERHGFEVVSTDLIDRGYGLPGVDFLKSETTFADCIITNPPFKLAEQFIRHALGALKVRQLALLLKATYWHAGTRSLPLFRDFPPTHEFPLTWRLDFTGGGAPTMDCTWFCWGGDAAFHWEPLPKPQLMAEALQ